MARKKQSAPDPELIEDDIEIDAKPIKGPARQVTETKTTKYIEPISEAEEEDSFDFEVKAARRKGKTGKEERDSLKAELAKANILPASNLRVHFWKFTHEHSEIAGGVADKAFCEKFFTTKDQLIAGHHLDIAKRYGAGRYWFMTYMDNKLVTSWEESIAAAPQFGQVYQANQNGQVVSVPDPQNPNVTIQMPAGQTPPQKTFKQELKEMAETFELMQKLNGNQQQQNPAQQLTPELQMAGFMLQDADLKKKAIKSLFGSNGSEGEKDIPTLLIENAEPIGKMLEGILDKIADRFFGANQNGQAQMATQGIQTHPVQMERQSPRLDATIQSNETGAASDWQGNSNGLQTNQFTENQTQQPTIAPEDALLAFVFDQCKRRIPPKIVARRILDQADYINQNAPIQSIDEFLIMFVEMPIEGALAFVDAYSEAGKEIVALEHTKTWCEGLQAELKPAFENGGQT